MLSTIYLHRIYTPQDISSTPQCISTGYVIHIIYISSPQYIPTGYTRIKSQSIPQDITHHPQDICPPQDIYILWRTLPFLSTGYFPQDNLSSTGYIHRIYVFIYCGMYPVEEFLYPVDTISCGRTWVLLMRVHHNI